MLLVLLAYRVPVVCTVPQEVTEALVELGHGNSARNEVVVLVDSSIEGQVKVHIVAARRVRLKEGGINSLILKHIENLLQPDCVENNRLQAS